MDVKQAWLSLWKVGLGAAFAGLGVLGIGLMIGAIVYPTGLFWGLIVFSMGLLGVLLVVGAGLTVLNRPRGNSATLE